MMQARFAGATDVMGRSLPGVNVTKRLVIDQETTVTLRYKRR